MVSFRFRFILVMVLCIAAGGVYVASAQSGDGGWSQPQVLFQVDDDNEGLWNPTILADPSGGVHVFWIYTSDRLANREGMYVYYTYWDGMAWSMPNSVLSSPDNRSAEQVKVVLDRRGVLHAMWLGARENVETAVYYSRAQASAAGSVRGWLSPVALLYLPELYASSPALAVDENGVLHAVYADGQASLLYYLRSDDGGDSWSDHVLMYTAPLNRWLSDFALTLDSAGFIHAVWVERPTFVSGEDMYIGDLFYSRSQDGGRTWTEPFEFASDRIWGQPNIITTGYGNVHLVWNGSRSDSGRYHRWSADGGETWTETVRILRVGGLSGSSQVAVDSAGTLHLITAGGKSPAVYVQWNGGGWTPSEDVDPGCYNEWLSMSISEGNKLNLIGLGIAEGRQQDFNRVWYLTRRVLAPAVPLRPLPTLVPSTTPAPKVMPDSTLVAPSSGLAEEILDSDLLSEDAMAVNQWFPLVVAILPALLLVGVVVAARVFKVIGAK